MSSRDEKRLEDMLRAIDSIEEYCPTTKDRLETREPLLSHVPSLKRDIQELLRQLRDRPDSTPGNR